MPYRRRQENKKSETGFPQNPTRPGGVFSLPSSSSTVPHSVVGSTSAATPHISSSVLTRALPRSQQLKAILPAPIQSSCLNGFNYSSANTAGHRYGTSQQQTAAYINHHIAAETLSNLSEISKNASLVKFQPPRPSEESITLTPIISNNITTGGGLLVSNRTLTVPQGYQGQRFIPSIPSTLLRSAPAATTAFPQTKELQLYTNSKIPEVKQYPHVRPEVIPFSSNDYTRPRLYPYGPEVLAGLRDKTLLTNTQLTQNNPNQNNLNTDKDLDHAYNISFSIGLNRANGIQSQPIYQQTPTTYSDPESYDRGISVPSEADFTPLNYLSSLACQAVKLETNQDSIKIENKEAIDRGENMIRNRRVILSPSQRQSSSTVTSDQQEQDSGVIAIKEENNPVLVINPMANGRMRIKQETLDRSSPEESGEVLDLRKSVAEKLCVWCGKKAAMIEDGVSPDFCSEVCFDLMRRDTFKKRSNCLWCSNTTRKGMQNGTSCISYSTGGVMDESKFCSDDCLNKFKVKLFCDEANAHVEQFKDIHHGSVVPNGQIQSMVGTPMTELITPDLWLKKQSGYNSGNKKGSSAAGTISSPNHTVSSGGFSPSGSQSSQHSLSPSNYLSQFPKLSGPVISPGTGLVSLANHNNAVVAATPPVRSTRGRRKRVQDTNTLLQQQSTVNNAQNSRKRAKSSSSSTTTTSSTITSVATVLPNIGPFGPQQYSDQDVQHVLIGSAAHGSGGGVHHTQAPKYRRLTPTAAIGPNTGSPGYFPAIGQAGNSPMLTSGGQIQPPRFGAPVRMNGNGLLTNHHLSQEIISGILYHLNNNPGNNLITSLGSFFANMGINGHQYDNGARPKAPNGLSNPCHYFQDNFVRNPHHSPGNSQGQSPYPHPEYSNTNTISTQTDDSGEPWNFFGWGRNGNIKAPFMLIPYPVPVPIPVIVPVPFNENPQPQASTSNSIASTSATSSIDKDEGSVENDCESTENLVPENDSNAVNATVTKNEESTENSEKSDEPQKNFPTTVLMENESETNPTKCDEENESQGSSSSTSKI